MVSWFRERDEHALYKKLKLLVGDEEARASNGGEIVSATVAS